MSEAYVFAVLGESPAVITELLWWLRHVEGTAIAGIEIWATRRGAERFSQLTQTPAWERFEQLAGPLPTLQPLGTDPSHEYGFRIHCFDDDGELLDDVRSRRQSGAVSERLHDRLCDLRTRLPRRIPVLGSLAGGRKTVSAALQTAFSLHAREHDRLVHVVLHAQLEASLRASGELRDYLCPDDPWTDGSGVDPNDQIQAYDVQFPRLRLLVPDPHLLDRSWDDLWSSLERDMRRRCRAVLALEGNKLGSKPWRFRIRDCDTDEALYERKLTPKLGVTFAAMATTPAGGTSLDVMARIDALDLGWTLPGEPGDEGRPSAMRDAARNLRAYLQTCPAGLRRFLPESGSYVVEGVDVVLDPYGDGDVLDDPRSESA